MHSPRQPSLLPRCRFRHVADGPRAFGTSDVPRHARLRGARIVSAMEGRAGPSTDAGTAARRAAATEAGARTVRALLVHDQPRRASALLRAVSAAGLALRPLRVDSLPALDGALRGRDWDVVLLRRPLARDDDDTVLARLLEAGPSTPIIVLADDLDHGTRLDLSANGVREVVLADDASALGKALARVFGTTPSDDPAADPSLTLAARVQRLVGNVEALAPALERSLELVCTALEQPYGETWLRAVGSDAFEPGPSFDGRPAYASLREGVPGSLATGVLREVVSTRQARVVADLRLDAGRRFERGRDALDHGLDGLTAVPVLVADQVKAVILTLGRDGRALDPRVRGVLQVAAEHIGALLGQRKAHGLLAREHAQLEALLDLLGEGVMACDANGRVTLFNRAMARFHGQRPAPNTDLEGWSERCGHFLADGVTAMRDAELPLLRALRGEHVDGERFVIAAPGARRRPVRAAARPIDHADGRRAGALMVVQDESQQVAASAAVAGASERALRSFTLLLDHLADLALRLGEATRLEEAWPAFADFAERTLGADELHVIRTDGADARRPRVLYATTRLSSAATSSRANASVSTLACESMLSRRLVIEHDAERPGLLPDRLMRSAAAVPMTIGNDLLGVLEVRSARPFAFDESAGVALTMAATLAAIALDHADLVETERRSRTVAEASARHFQQIFAANPAAVAIVTPEEHRIIDVNPAMEVLSGFDRGALVGCSALELGLWSEDDAHAFSHGNGHADGDGEHEMRLRRRDGTRRTCLVSAETTALVREGGGLQQALLVLALDVTDRLEQQRQLRDLARFREGLVEFVGETLSHGFDDAFYQRLLEAAVRATPGAGAGSLLLRDPSDDAYRFVAASGYDLDGLGDLSFDDAAVDGDTDTEHGLVHTLQRMRARPARLETAPPSDASAAAPASLYVPIEVEGRRMAVLCLDSLRDPEAFDDEARALASAFATQVGTLIKRRALEHELEHMAYHDTLTGLPNRALFRDRLQQAVTRSHRHDHRGAALFVDLDNLKVTNDTLGHAIGDALLRAVAERLLATVRGEDTVARMGGDEFTVVLSEVADAGAAASVAEKLLTALRHPFQLLGHEVHVSASIGITLFPDDGTDADTLIRHGDTAMYQAKAQGKDRYRFFTREMNRALLERASLEAQLRLALQRDELRLHFQPRVALVDGRITSVEALARWWHPERGEVPPSAFIPVAEDAGLIGAVGTHLLRMACRQARAWCDAGVPTVVAFNLSPKQLQERDVVDTVRRVLEEAGLDPRWLELELTESAVMRNVAENVVRLGQLRALGVHVSIDDFGTAYSSLNYLKQLPATALKIDQSFVRDVAVEGEAGRHDSAIVRAVVALAKALELTAIAEGVETEAQLRFLRELGCDQGQGYLFAYPADADSVTSLLREGRIPLP